MKDVPPIRVAYADDHDIVRAGICHVINRFANFEVVVEARNGRELIKKIGTIDILPDICLIDINMPVLNGFETLVEIKKMWPEMKTLILTVFNLEMYVIRMILNGANGYILKDSKPDEFKKALRAIYSDGHYYSEAISGHFFKSVLNHEKKLPDFSPIEVEVLRYSCSDMSYAQIAEKMKLTTRSVECHRDRLFNKLQVHSRPSLVMKAIELGYVPIEAGQVAVNKS